MSNPLSQQIPPFNWTEFSIESRGHWVYHLAFPGRRPGQPLLLYRPWPKDTHYGVWIALNEGRVRAGWYHGATPTIEKAQFIGEWSKEVTWEEGRQLITARTGHKF